MHRLLIVMLLLCNVVSAQVTINNATIGAGVGGTAIQYTDESYFTTIPYADGCQITAYNIAGGDSVIVPPTINSLQVRSIDDGALDGFETGLQLTNLILPEGLTHIGEMALANNKFRSIVIPSTVTTADLYALDYGFEIPGAMLKTVKIPAGFTSNHLLGYHSTVNKIIIGAGCTITYFSELMPGFEAAYAAGGAGTYIYVNGWTKVK